LAREIRFRSLPTPKAGWVELVSFAVFAWLTRTVAGKARRRDGLGHLDSGNFVTGVGLYVAARLRRHGGAA